MTPLRRSLARILMVVVVLLAAHALWAVHMTAWNPGMRTPVLGYDAAQYAVAASHLAEQGSLGTTYAMPIELARHATPPWPLAVIQPGLVVVNAWIFAVTPKIVRLPGLPPMLFNDPARREALVLVFPFLCFLALASALAWGTVHLIQRARPEAPLLQTTFAGLTIAAVFLLDPESQHFAASGLTEIPFTLGLAGALAALALGHAHRRPLLFGLMLGLTGLFRGNVLWIAPWFAAGAALAAPPGRRLRVLGWVAVAWALPLAPWWLYKWQAFGNPAWDLSVLSLWDGVGGRSWFSLNHLPEWPALPQGAAAAGLLAAKIADHLPQVLLMVFTGPRALWVGALILWLAVTPRHRPAWIAGAVLLGAMATNLLVTAATIPLLRYSFPVRVLIEAAGILALWDLAGRLARDERGAPIVRVVRIGIAAIAIAWGLFMNQRGLDEARTVSAARGTPLSYTVNQLVDLIDAEVPANEPVMSNLGPLLAFRGRRPVVHLATTPDDVAACRERLPFRNVILVFRNAENAWRGWDEIVARPAEAPARREWNIAQLRQFESIDGFKVIWLELGPAVPGLALAR